jgi:hypothetical protein
VRPAKAIKKREEAKKVFIVGYSFILAELGSLMNRQFLTL